MSSLPGFAGNFVAASIDADLLRDVIGNQPVQTNEQGEVRFLTTAAGGQFQGLLGLNSYQAVALVNPSDDADQVEIDINAIRGQTRSGIVNDESGEPLTGVQAIGLGASGTSVTFQPLETAEFNVEGLTSGRTRSLLFVHHERELGAQVIVTGDESTPMTVHLQPTGMLTGRFVDELGEPLANVVVELAPVDPPISGSGFWRAESDDEGRFRITGLIADSRFRAHAQPVQSTDRRLLVRAEIGVASGETLDLGTLTQTNEYQFGPVAEEGAAE